MQIQMGDARRGNMRDRAAVRWSEYSVPEQHSMVGGSRVLPRQVLHVRGKLPNSPWNKWDSSLGLSAVSRLGLSGTV